MPYNYRYYRNRICIMAGTLILSITLLLASSQPAQARHKATIRVGNSFPNLALPVPTDQQSRTYLGLPQGKKSFKLNQLDAKIVLIEFFNTHCPHCQEQAPVYVDLFNKVTASKYNDQIKIISITLGNSIQEVATFRQRYHIPYPILLDRNFVIWREVGGQGSPFTIIVNNSIAATPVVCATHLGVNHSHSRVFAQLVKILKMTPSQCKDMVAAATEELPPPPPPFSPQAMKEDVADALQSHGRVVGLKKVAVDHFDNVYSARVYKNRKSRRLYAHAIHRVTACDICHDSYFITIFAADGTIVDIVPLTLTKRGNKPWDNNDIRKLKQRLIGHNLAQPCKFDPKVDAITAATITSSMIFASIDHDAQLLHALGTGRNK